jgi:two-component system phosphate regulon sensor histidine kinase PhoR
MSPKRQRRAPSPREEDAIPIIAVAAHELKNALGGIGVALARCEQRLLAGKTVTADDLAVARGELRRLSALVNDLLDGARVDLGVVDLQPSRVDVAALANDVVSLFRADHERPVILEQPPRAFVIDADAERLRAALLNYLENAVKYAPAPAPIAVSIRDSPIGGRVRIAVRDEGPGIPPEDQTRLFERFFRAPATAERTRGLGLGLFLCRAIAEAHGGAAGVDSTPGSGATFWMDLPVTVA